MKSQLHRKDSTVATYITKAIIDRVENGEGWAA